MMVEQRVPVIPRNDLVLLMLDPEQLVTAGGIQLVAGKKISKATVIAVGPGAVSDNIPAPYRMPMSLAVGERVYIGGNQFSCEFIDGDDRLILLPEKMILGTLPPVTLEIA